MHAAWRDNRLQSSRSAPSCIRQYIATAHLCYPGLSRYLPIHGSMPSVSNRSHHIAVQRIATHARGTQWRRLAPLRCGSTAGSICILRKAAFPLLCCDKFLPAAPAPPAPLCPACHPLHSSPHCTAMSDACATAKTTSAYLRD